MDETGFSRNETEWEVGSRAGEDIGRERKPVLRWRGVCPAELGREAEEDLCLGVTG